MPKTKFTYRLTDYQTDREDLRDIVAQIEEYEGANNGYIIKKKRFGKRYYWAVHVVPYKEKKIEQDKELKSKFEGTFWDMYNVLRRVKRGI